MSDRVTGTLEKWIRRVLGHLISGPLDYHARYEGRVQAAASDGSTVDVLLDVDDPDNDRRMPSPSGVPLKIGMPGSVVLKQGSRVLVGWKQGDPDKPFAEAMATASDATKTVLLGDVVYLGGEASAQFLARADRVASALNAIVNAFNTHQHTGVVTGGGTTGAPSSPMGSPSSTAASQVKGI